MVAKPLPQQTYTGPTGKQVQFPAAYSTFDQYREVLRINMIAAKRNPRLFDKFGKTIEANIKEANEAAGNTWKV